MPTIQPELTSRPHLHLFNILPALTITHLLLHCQLLLYALVSPPVLERIGREDFVLYGFMLMVIQGARLLSGLYLAKCFLALLHTSHTFAQNLHLALPRYLTGLSCAANV